MEGFMQETVKKNQEDAFFGVDEEDEDTQANKYMTFRIGAEAYGIGISHIREIIELQKITAVPDMPDFVKGVINLRGRVLPVVDLRLRFGLEEREYDDRTCIVITEIRTSAIGFIVDTVEEVAEIAEKDIEPAPVFRSASGKDQYISGIGKIGEAVKLLLDVERLLFEDDLHTIVEGTATLGNV
jgi:purine-binding chemotaxis protein CheW